MLINTIRDVARKEIYAGSSRCLINLHNVGAVSFHMLTEILKRISSAYGLVSPAVEEYPMTNLIKLLSSFIKIPLGC